MGTDKRQRCLGFFGLDRSLWIRQKICFQVQIIQINASINMTVFDSLSHMQRRMQSCWFIEVTNIGKMSVSVKSSAQPQMQSQNMQINIVPYIFLLSSIIITIFLNNPLTFIIKLFNSFHVCATDMNVELQCVSSICLCKNNYVYEGQK